MASYQRKLGDTNLVINSQTGNVGVGTNNPNKKLVVSDGTVKTDIGASEILRVAGTSQGVGRRNEIGFSPYDFDYNPHITLGMEYVSTAAYCSSDFYIATRALTTDTAPIERFRITSGGKVGIATNDPQTLLNIDVGSGGTHGVAGLRIGGTDNYPSLELGTYGAYGGMVRSYGNDLHYFAGHWRTIGNTASENHSHYWYTSKASSTDWSTVKMELDHNGNLGIGTTSPDGKLTVRDDNAGGAAKMIISNGGTVQSGTTARLSFYEGADEKSYIERRRDGTGITAFVTPADDNPFSFINASGEFIRMVNSNLGIGLTNPTAILHTDGDSKLGGGGFYASTDQTFLTSSAYTFRDAVYINNPNSLSAAVSSDTVMSIGSMTSGTSLITTGTVGIGLTSPESTSLLHLKNTAASAKITLETSDSYESLMNFSAASNEYSIGFNKADNTFRIANANSLASGVRMVIDGSGNIGISSTSPTYRLDVNGDGRFTGKLYVETLDNGAQSDKFLVSNSNEVEYRTTAEVRSDLQALTYVYVQRYVTGSGGWHRIARIARGGARFSLAYTGGNFSPTNYAIDAYKNWSGDASIKVEKYGFANFIDGVRIVQELNGGSSDYYLEADFISLTPGLNHDFRGYVQYNQGFSNTSEEWAADGNGYLYATDATAGAIEEITLTGADGIFNSKVFSSDNISIGSQNLSYNLYNNGTTYFNGQTYLDDQVDLTSGYSFNFGTSRLHSTDTSYFLGGSVGIGTSSPISKLHIVDTTNITASNSGIGQLSVEGSGYTLGIALDSEKAHIYHNSSLRDLSFGTNESIDMTIEGSSGNVGIGTTAPTQKLEVHGNIYAYNGELRLVQGYGITWNNGDNYIKGIGGYHLQFTTYDGSSAQVEVMRLTGGTAANGGARAGIGVTSPQAKLHVGGDAIFDGRIRGAELGNPDITRNGLTFYIDLNDKASHSGTSSTEIPIDLGPNSYTMALYGGANFEYKNGIGSFYFDNSGDILQIENFYVGGTANTYEAWVYMENIGQGGSTWDTIWDSGNERPLLGLTSGRIAAYPGTYASTDYNPATGRWHQIVWAFAGNNDIDIYLNGERILEAEDWSNGGSYTQRTGTFTSWIGGDTGVETFQGWIAIARHYDRQLAPEEVLQNYNADVRRFATVSPELGIVQKAGSVGIGTDVPDATLDVKGNIRIPNQGKIVFGTAGTPDDYLELNDVNATGKILKLVQDGTTRFDVEGVTGDIYMQGNVGVGTTTPNPHSWGSKAVTIQAAGTNAYSAVEAYGTGTGAGALLLGAGSVMHASVQSVDGSHLIFTTNASNSGTSQTEAMRITSSGNVGIGNTPGYKLDVSGTARLGGRLLRGYGAVMSTSGSAYYLGTIDTYGNGDGAGASFEIYDGHQRTWRRVEVALQDAGGTNNLQYSIEGGGREADISVVFAYVNRSGDATKTDFFFIPVANKSYTQRILAQGVLIEDTGYSSAGATEVSLDSNITIFKSISGEVGIGTTSPGIELEVAGGIRATAGTSNGLRVHSNSGITASNNYMNFFTSQTSGWAFNANGTGADSTTKVVITAAGNVGIGVTAPSNTLHVKGAIISEDDSTTSTLYIGQANANVAEFVISPSDDTNANYFSFRPNSQNAGAGIRIWDRYEDDYLHLRHDNSRAHIATDSDGGDIYISPQGSTSIAAKADGKVGIGTTSPGWDFDVARTSRFGDGIRVESKAGTGNWRAYYNVLDFAYDGNYAGAIVLNTAIPRNSNEMLMIHVKGYGYGHSTTIDFKVVVYPYSGTNGQDSQPGAPYNYSIQDNGTDDRPKFIGINADDNLAIAIGDYNDANKYYYRLTVDYHAARLGTDSYAIGWTHSQSQTAGFGWVDKRNLNAPIKTTLNGATTFNNAFTFPTSDGTSGQVLQTNGSGTVSWGTVSGGSATTVETVASNTNATRYLTFVDSNNGTAAAETIYTTDGIYVNPSTDTIYATGNIISYASSDRRLKDNLKPIENASEKISKISGYEFDWNDKAVDFEGHDVGVVAQEIEEVLPEVVTERKDGYKAVKYEKIVALLIEGMKEQQKEIEELKERINQLEK